MKLNEVKLLQENYDFSTREGIHKWLYRNGNREDTYVMHEDGSISSENEMLIHDIGNLTKLPVKFRKVKEFKVYDLPITTLENFPDEAEYVSIVSSNITNLIGITPKSFGYHITHCHKLKTFEGLPSYIDGFLFVKNCDNLESLKGSPISISRDVEINKCKRLTSLKGAPREVGGYFDVSRNNLTSLKYSPKYIGEAYYVDNNPLTSLDGVEKSVIEYGIDAHNTKIPQSEKSKYPDIRIILD